MNQEIYFAGGCFWGMEKYFSCISGVARTAVGYANGKTENPSYEEVCHNDTGHAETVRVEYRPGEISLGELLHLFFEAIDPVALNRQGGDSGTQYRTGVYFSNPGDEAAIQAALQSLSEKIGGPVAVEYGRLVNFYPAEEYHQQYLDKNPAGYCHISPALFRHAADYRRQNSKN